MLDKYRQAYVSLWFIFLLYLLGASADCRETLTYHWKYGHLDTVGPKFGASPQNWGQMV